MTSNLVLSASPFFRQLGQIRPHLAGEYQVSNPFGDLQGPGEILSGLSDPSLLLVQAAITKVGINQIELSLIFPKYGDGLLEVGCGMDWVTFKGDQAQQKVSDSKPLLSPTATCKLQEIFCRLPRPVIFPG